MPNSVVPFLIRFAQKLDLAASAEHDCVDCYWNQFADLLKNAFDAYKVLEFPEESGNDGITSAQQLMFLIKLVDEAENEEDHYQMLKHHYFRNLPGKVTCLGDPVNWEKDILPNIDEDYEEEEEVRTLALQE